MSEVLMNSKWNQIISMVFLGRTDITSQTTDIKDF